MSNSRKVDWGSRTSRKTAGTDVVLDDSLVIKTPRPVLWTRMRDVPFVAGCLPGVVLDSLQEVSPTEYRANMLQSVMGYDSNWDLQAVIEPNDDDNRLHVRFDGTDKRLGMTLTGQASIVVTDGEPGESVVGYKANLRVNGSLAAVGGPVIRSTVSETIERFVAGVGGAELPAAEGFFARLGMRLRGLWDRIARKQGVS